uniref:Uncharacterized protein n=1 Tax=Globisporangium ultimum (strain ATCC 200006 / CBS 805.95 / DAOM BR144) TaxID=431595 RepID=K3W6E9_GLOUD
MDSLPLALYIALLIVVWQLATSSNYALALFIPPYTDANDPVLQAILKSSTSDAFVALRFDVPLRMTASGNDDQEDTRSIMMETQALAADLRCFGWIQPSASKVLFVALRSLLSYYLLIS